MNDRDIRLRTLLQAELDLMEHDGQAENAPAWTPRLIFQDSSSCIRYDAHRSTCDSCPLMPFVPPTHKEKSSPCRYIPLTRDGRTLNDLYQSGSEEDLREAVRQWLVHRLDELDSESSPVRGPAWG
jgi:hypothetical protein